MIIDMFAEQNAIASEEMSSINPHFTFTYSQPEDYRFSHDSVFLARRIYEIVSSEGIHYNRVLDLCAGSGIVGLDFIFHLQQSGKPRPQTADFLEIQPQYLAHFEENKKALGVESFCNFLNINYQDLSNDPKFENYYDLIMCNPPYFRVGHGALSPNEFKNRCRFFIDASFNSLLKAIEFALAPGGNAFVLIKNLDLHGVQVEEEIVNTVSKLHIKKLQKVREVDLYQLTKV